jgi:predicted metal-dependent hydrolase
MHKILTCKDLQAELIYTPKRKHSYIQVKYDSTIIIKTPYKNERYAMDFFQDKELWIRKQLHKNAKNKQIQINLEDEILLFGEVYSMDTQEASYLRKKLHKLRINTPNKILALYDDFYKYTAQEYLQSRAEHFSKIMNLEYKKLRYRKMKSRWGSCSSKKEITFNTQLMKLDKALIDYVIVHELAHLVHMNHSKKFHELVEFYLLEAKELRKRVKDIHFV